MRKFFCCGCWSTKTSARPRFNSDVSDEDDDEQQTNLEDLMLHPNKIDSKLDQGISEWQEAINEYKLFEDNYLELNDDADRLYTIIDDLRVTPEKFTAEKYSVHVRKLAEKKIIVNQMQTKLGISKEIQLAQLASQHDKFNDAHELESPPTPMNKTISTKLSVMWANRLNEINPTQGAIRMSEAAGSSNNNTNRNSQNTSPKLNRHASMEMKIRPKWPDFLIDTSYDVVKVNRFGHKMRRTLKLTQNHVIGIKNGCEISKFYHFNDIRRVWLESGNTIHVQQRNKKNNIYMSPIAAHILQQITTRVQVRISLDKTEFKGITQGIGYSSAATAGIIRNIAEENTLETEAVMATFANDLKERTIRTMSMDYAGGSSRSAAGSIDVPDTTADNDNDEDVTSELDTDNSNGNSSDNIGGGTSSRSQEQAYIDEINRQLNDDKIRRQSALLLTSPDTTSSSSTNNTHTIVNNSDNTMNSDEDADGEVINVLHTSLRITTNNVEPTTQPDNTSVTSTVNAPPAAQDRLVDIDCLVDDSVAAPGTSAVCAHNNTNSTVDGTAAANTINTAAAPFNETAPGADQDGTSDNSVVESVLVDLIESVATSSLSEVVLKLDSDAETTSDGAVTGATNTDSGVAAAASEEQKGGEDEGDSTRLSARLSSSSVSSSSRSQGKHSSPSISNKANAPRFLNFKEGMPEHSTQSAVQKVIFDPSTSEGNTRKIFIDKFILSAGQGGNYVHRRDSDLNSASTANSVPHVPRTPAQLAENKAKLLEIRLFIDGMHEYMLAHRGISLGILFEQEKQRYIINSKAAEAGEATNTNNISNNNNSNNANSNIASAVSYGSGSGMKNIEEFTNSSPQPLQSSRDSHKTSKQRRIVRRASLKFLNDNIDLSIVEESILVFISFIIFIVVEEAIFLPLKNQIISLLPNGGRMDEEIALVSKMKAFSNRTQAQWGVPEDLVSPLGWQSAIFELAGVEHNLTPSSQLHILTRTVKAVYTEFKLVVLPRLQAMGKHDVYIGADDLVPIFMYVFCQSNLRHPIRNRDLMWSLCHPDQLHGEGGYYLTVYESCIEFILNEPLSNESFFCERESAVSTLVTSAKRGTNNPLHGNNSNNNNSTTSNNRSNSSSNSSGKVSFDEVSIGNSSSSSSQFSTDSNHRSRNRDPRSKVLTKVAASLGLSHWFTPSRDSEQSDYSMRESFY